MGHTYNQLTLAERYQIEALKKLGLSARAIAQRLGRSNKTISQEINRCPSDDYCAQSSHFRARSKRHHAAKFTRQSKASIALVDRFLTLDLSPEQIAGRMRLEGSPHAVSMQTIYRMVKRRHWQKRLPRRGSAYRKRSAQDAGAHLIPDRTDIDERPAIVQRNEELGHWEGDTVHGQDGYFVTLVERVSKVFLFKRVRRKTKQQVGDAVQQLLKPFKGLCKTITFDNGGEFAGHKCIAKALKCKIYFAKPYHSWQRGLNENSNGLLRRYFPKGMAIGSLDEQRIQEACFLINSRPRKALNYLGPLEFLAGKRVSLMMEI